MTEGGEPFRKCTSGWRNASQGTLQARRIQTNERRGGKYRGVHRGKRQQQYSRIKRKYHYNTIYGVKGMVGISTG
jgi:hypothetical protein